MQSHPLISCTTFCISIGLTSFSPNPQYTFRSVPHKSKGIAQKTSVCAVNIRKTSTFAALFI
ncbi:hypothetical protein GAQ52_18195 [Bacteroides uniformis]|nr:hypothetical protein GAS26_18230 [Bacteroides uniformis]KAB3927085.1 hypothetical protein GAS16_06440 [Bacteroides uniformis]KAB3936560.1 hypothetical protein GAS27_15485 [Bacteroides uniformis]KAB3952969.1 hypothetical protein GAS20_05550 [Bacteroides uniformis]KAB3967395.1 hypothetical protein GAS21_04980 [Bacteroides uniformis]